jgi:hypothetical protein
MLQIKVINNYLVPILMFSSLLGVFVKLRKATIGFVMAVCPSVRPSVRMEQLGSHWTDFH